MGAIVSRCGTDDFRLKRCGTADWRLRRCAVPPCGACNGEVPYALIAVVSGVTADEAPCGAGHCWHYQYLNSPNGTFVLPPRGTISCWWKTFWYTWRCRQWYRNIPACTYPPGACCQDQCLTTDTTFDVYLYVQRASSSFVLWYGSETQPISPSIGSVSTPNCLTGGSGSINAPLCTSFYNTGSVTILSQ